MVRNFPYSHSIGISLLQDHEYTKKSETTQFAQFYAKDRLALKVDFASTLSTMFNFGI